MLLEDYLKLIVLLCADVERESLRKVDWGERVVLGSVVAVLGAFLLGESFYEIT